MSPSVADRRAKAELRLGTWFESSIAFAGNLLAGALPFVRISAHTAKTQMPVVQYTAIRDPRPGYVSAHPSYQCTVRWLSAACDQPTP